MPRIDCNNYTPLHLDYMLILRLMCRMHARGVSMSFGEVQQLLIKVEERLRAR